MFLPLNIYYSTCIPVLNSCTHDCSQSIYTLFNVLVINFRGNRSLIVSCLREKVSALDQYVFYCIDLPHSHWHHTEGFYSLVFPPNMQYRFSCCVSEQFHIWYDEYFRPVAVIPTISNLQHLSRDIFAWTGSAWDILNSHPAFMEQALYGVWAKWSWPVLEAFGVRVGEAWWGYYFGQRQEVMPLATRTHSDKWNSLNTFIQVPLRIPDKYNKLPLLIQSLSLDCTYK